MKNIIAVALWISAFASCSASAEHKLHPADVMDSGQMGVGIAVMSRAFSVDYRTAGFNFNFKQEIDATLVAIALRYGVTGSLELKARLPYLQRKTRYSGSFFSGNSYKHSCFSDPSFGAAFKPLTAASRGIDFVVKLDIQPQSADSDTCGNGYTKKSMGLVISKPIGNLRPYVDLAMNNRNNNASNSNAFELGAEWEVSPVLALTALYNQETYFSNSFSAAVSQQLIGIGAAYAVQSNMWLGAQFGRISAKDHQASVFSNNDTTVTNAKGNVFLVGVQILY